MLVYPTGIPTGGSGYTIENSLWFDGSADYLTKTFSGAGTSRTVYTVSFWAKPSTVSPTGGNNYVIAVGASSSATENLRYTGGGLGSLYIEATDGAEALHTGDAARFRDLTAWQHVVWARNTGNADGSKNKLYVNGVRITSFDSSYGTRSQNLTSNGNFGGTDPYSIGRDSYGGTVYYNGYLAEFAVIDGTEYAASDFGEYDDNGVWIPVDSSGLTYGDNGFLLQFKQTGSGQDANGIGADTSGKDNHFAVGGGSIQTNQVTDTPTDDANNDIGNYWTLNPLQSNNTLTGGNLAFTGPTNYSNYSTAPALPMSGKWYWEIKAVGSAAIGSSANWDTYVGVLRTDVAIPSGSQTSNANIWVWGNMAKDGSGANGAKHNNSSDPLTPAVNFVDNSIMMIAVDMDNSKIYFGNDGTWAGSGNPAGNSGAAFDSSDNSFGSHQVMPYQNLYADSATYNFGATAFAHTPPTGFKALNTANLPAPTVTDPSAYFQAKIYTGNGGTQAITFEDTTIGKSKLAPDLVWVKCRDVAYHHQVFDRVRGTSNPNNISPDLPDEPVNGELTAFSATDGFTLVHNGAVGRANTSGDAYVAYAFKAGGSSSTTSPAGTIASSTSVADHGGFSIGTFTAPSTSSTAFTVGHGLSRVPTMITVKTLGAAGGWWTWIDEFAATGNYLRFDASGGTYSDGTFLSATPTDEVFATNTSWLTTDHEHSFYAFAKTSGLIASGTFVGTGVTDGSYIVMDDGASGFRPAWFMFKHLSGGGSWYIVDSARNTYNTGTAVGTAKLLLDNNKTEATIHSETTNGILDFTANGVKFRGSNGSDFQGSGTFFYLAFAENPFGGDGVAQAKAR